MNNDFDKSESIWKIDGPIGRLDFFWSMLACNFFILPVYLLARIGLAVFLFPVCIILVLIAIWLMFAAFSKRFYDITGQLKWGIIITILMIIICIIIPIVATILLVIGLALPGKLLKYTDDDESK